MIDRCGSLSFAIRGIPSSIRPPNRHSGEGRNTEGKGGTNHTQTLLMTRSHFHTLVCRRPPAWAIGTKIVIRCHRIRHSGEGRNPEGKGGTNHTQTPPTTKPRFHTLVRRRPPAWTIGTKIDLRHPSRHSSESWNPEGEVWVTGMRMWTMARRRLVRTRRRVCWALGWGQVPAPHFSRSIARC